MQTLRRSCACICYPVLYKSGTRDVLHVCMCVVMCVMVVVVSGGVSQRLQQIVLYRLCSSVANSLLTKWCMREKVLPE
jgi:hypothetical protein